MLFDSLQTQSFHTPSFGEEFDDIPMLHESTQFQLQPHELNMTDSYNQWHQQPTSDSHMMSNQSYQMPAAAANVTANQQTATSYLANADQLGMMYSHAQDTSSLLPQISPQVNVTGNNYIGQTTPASQEGIIVQGLEAAALTSDESDDLNDPNVS